MSHAQDDEHMAPPLERASMRHPPTPDPEPLGGASSKFISNLKRLGWHWLEVIAVPVAVVAAFGAYWQASAAASSLADQRVAAREATAAEVVITGGSAPAGKLAKGNPVIGGGDWSLGLQEVPNLVQNYGRLPISNVSIEVNIVRSRGQTRNYVVPIGTLGPCRQVGVTDGGYLEKSGQKDYVSRIDLFVLFTDPNGNKWKRGVGAPPIGVEVIPDIDMALPNDNDIVRTGIQQVSPCGGG